MTSDLAAHGCRRSRATTALAASGSGSSARSVTGAPTVSGERSAARRGSGGRRGAARRARGRDGAHASSSAMDAGGGQGAVGRARGGPRPGWARPPGQARRLPWLPGTAWANVDVGRASTARGADGVAQRHHVADGEVDEVVGPVSDGVEPHGDLDRHVLQAGREQRGARPRGPAARASLSDDAGRRAASQLARRSARTAGRWWRRTRRRRPSCSNEATMTASDGGGGLGELRVVLDGRRSAGRARPAARRRSAARRSIRSSRPRSSGVSMSVSGRSGWLRTAGAAEHVVDAAMAVPRENSSTPAPGSGSTRAGDHQVGLASAVMYSS